MKERLDFALPSTSELTWELAAVAFFDESESPYKYDPYYAKQKIAVGSRMKTYPLFFKCRINDLVSLPNLSEEGLATYLKAVEAVNASHINLVLDKLSSAQRKTDFLGHSNPN